ncbi:Cysteine desulfurase (EC [Olavius algarvensis associated proteobacterium Delta 3]|nr:Cysteine desulfurase (EC [Olavius algarvensis associated proteobacterium Delta 3]CAB5117295.1 Cysteine desulfurase (EC [Olavius algarvensis associated proteobacterium Delta 3]
MKQPIYLDYNGTTPHDPRVIEAMRPYLEEVFGNPSSSNWYGRRPKQAVEQSRGQVADCLGCHPEEILFTSGGTESNNHAIKSIAGSLFARGNHIITSQIEHPAILEVCRFMEGHGFKVTYLPVDARGRVSVSDVEAIVTPKTVMISIMHANNEVGTIQPIREIAAIARANGALMHTDAAQSIGKIPADVNDLMVDLLSLAGHKLYAPKGIGALFIRRNINASRFCHGAGQEMGRRGGTENVLEIVGLGTACNIARKDLDANRAHMERMRNRLELGLTGAISDVRINGHPEWRLPNTLSISFLGLEATRILEDIGPDVAASAGAACHADTVTISHVLKAMNVPEDWAKGTLRLTTGRMTTEKDIDRVLEVISTAVQKLRA